MRRFRISRLMLVIALLGLDAGVLRVFIVEGNPGGVIEASLPRTTLKE